MSNSHNALQTFCSSKERVAQQRREGEDTGKEMMGEGRGV